MSEPIGLQEAIDIIENMSLEDAMNDGRLMKFFQEVDNIATDILSDKGQEYLLGAIGLIQSISLSVIIDRRMKDGDFASVLTLMELAGNKEFSALMTVAFKMSVGLSAMEELK